MSYDFLAKNGIMPCFPVTAGDILDRSVSLYRQNLKPLCSISALAHIPYFLFLVIYLIILSYNMGDSSLNILFFFIFIPLWSIVLSLSQGWGIYFLSGIIIGKPAPDVFSTFKALLTCDSTHRSFFHIKVVKLSFVIILFAFTVILFFTPFIFFFYFVYPHIPRSGSFFIFSTVFFLVFVFFLSSLFTFSIFIYNMAISVVILEESGLFSSIKRAFLLVRRNFFKTTVVPSLLMIMLYILQAAITVPFVVIAFFLMSEVFLHLTAQVVSMFSSVIMLPLVFSGNALIYYSIRFEKEGYDLELMADEIYSKSL